MLTVRVVPCLDVDAGRVVKGVKFQGLRDAGDPAVLGERYEQEGADELVMLDVSATPEGRRTQVSTVAAVRARLGIPLCVGGGVRAVRDVERLLGAGADKVAVNTAAVMTPPLVDEMAARFGSQCTVVAVDARRVAPSRWEVVIRSGRESADRDAVTWMREVANRGAGEILLTSWDRDGTKEGYDLALLTAAAAAVDIPIIASGGASGPDHMIEALRAGADAVLAASIFHFGEYRVGEVKRCLAEAGLSVRR